MSDAYTTYTRVALVPTIAHPASPLLSEIGAGLDLTDQLTPEGLVLPRTTESVETTVWRSSLLTKRPTRFSFDGALLQAERCGSPSLWDVATFKAASHLVVRSSLTALGLWDESPFHGGETVDVYTLQFGMRSPDPSAAGDPITFTVPLFISAANESATVVDDVIDDEDGDPILTEDGGFLLTEGDDMLLLDG